MLCSSDQKYLKWDGVLAVFNAAASATCNVDVSFDVSIGGDILVDVAEGDGYRLWQAWGDAAWAGLMLGCGGQGEMSLSVFARDFSTASLIYLDDDRCVLSLDLRNGVSYGIQFWRLADA